MAEMETGGKERIRLGQTGYEELLAWMRRQGRPVTLHQLATRYLEILKELAQVDGTEPRQTKARSRRKR